MRHTIEFIRNFLDKEGFVLLSTEYKNAHTKLSYLCPSGHQHNSSWSKFREGIRCPLCSWKRLGDARRKSVNIIKESMQREGYLLLSDYSKDAKSPIKCSCPKGHIYQTTWDRFNGGNRCTICANWKRGQTFILSKEDVCKAIIKEGYIPLLLTYVRSNDKFDVQCPAGHTYGTCWDYFRCGVRCPKCAGNQKLTLEQINAFFEQNKYQVSKIENTPYGPNVHYICPLQHRNRMIWSNFQQGHRCPKCSTSVNEKKLGEILEGIFPGKVRHLDNLDCLGLQKVDYSVRDLHLAFEYDGEQHFKSVEYFGGQEGLLRQQERDTRKESKCQENGYVLIRVAYYEKLDRETVQSKVRKIMERYA
jgi:very-short-patch-repair endonuclease/DNA-directed RNA polymerase subunit RPC12/RpoP